MKRVLQLSILFILAVIICTGCEGDVTRAIRHEGFAIGDQDVVCEPFFREENRQVMKYITSDRIITTDGTIYELSLGQKYSNNSHCRIADTNLKVKAIYDDRVFKAEDGNFYSLTGQNNGGDYKQITSTDNSYAVYNLLLKPDDVIKAQTADSSNGIFYVLKTDGNVYAITITKANYNAAPAIVGSVVVYSKEDYGGIITDFNYAGDSGATFVRTDNMVYRMKASNFETCSKYVDIKCEYQMMEAPVFAEQREYIYAYNGSLIVTSYKKYFTLAS